MKEMFQELYNKVLSLFNSSRETLDPTKSIAMNRLKTVLMQDRVGFSERAMQMMKEELTSCILKYVEAEPDEIELEINAEDDGKSVLKLAIPVLRAKTDDEIDKNIKEEENRIQKKAQEIVKELEGLIKERAQAISEGEIDQTLFEEAAKKASQDKKDENGETKEESSIVADKKEIKKNPSSEEKTEVKTN